MVKHNEVGLILTVLLISLILLNTSEFIFFPAAAQTGSNSGYESNIGLLAYVNTGRPIDLNTASYIFNTIDYSDANSISGTYAIYSDNYNTEYINIYITRNGFVAAYYSSSDPASKIISWSGDKTIYSKFATAITSAGTSLGINIDYKNIKYYDYRYPDANRILITTQSVGESSVGDYSYGNLKFNIPSYAEVYEVSYSLYLNDVYAGGANIAIDSNVIDSIANNGVIYNSYYGYISPSTDHLLGVMSNMYAAAGVAMIIIYKDDSDNSNNRATVSVTNADYSYDGSLDNPMNAVPTYSNTYIPETTPMPTKRPPVINVPVPTVEITQMPTEETGGSPTPAVTRNINKPPKASVDLHGERTNIELGQQSLLKGSIVSFNTNKDKMHAQVIIIPPSGISVVAADFVKSPAGQYTSDFELDPGKGKDIEVTIIPNEVGEFKVISKVSYYFGNDRDDNGYEEINLPIKAKPRSEGQSQPQDGQTTPSASATPSAPGFEMIFNIISILLIALILKMRK